MKKKFLYQVAEYYAAKARSGAIDLSKYTFVFPNNRSAKFMQKYLESLLAPEHGMPRLDTITAFAQGFCDVPLGSQMELLFILYKAYLDVLERKGRKEQARDFDNFIFWGNILLGDFNDVDSYLIDPVEIFKNIKAEREITANYLTPEQVEVANMISNSRKLQFDPDTFWKHIPHNDKNDSAYAKYVALWEILLDLYLEFNHKLRTLGITYSGMLSRLACKHICSMGKTDFHGQKYAFIGFYVLPYSREKIFKHLKEIGVADFFWDIASPLLSLPGSKAGDMIMPLAKAMPAPQDFELEEIKMADIAKFEIMPVATNIGQTKIASHVLSDWLEKSPRILDDANTALILPNDRLLNPMLLSLPQQVGELNVAMQVPYSTTPFATFLSSILRMQERARQIRGTFHYYYRDVFEILAQPYLRLLAAEDVEKLRTEIEQNHAYNISAADTAANYPALAPIFTPVSNTRSAQEVKVYLLGLIDTLRTALEKNGKKPENKDAKPYEITILDRYRNAIEKMFSFVEKHGILALEHTYFSLLRKLLILEKIKFSGDPVEGLQILGVQDARGLDFDNLIMISLNERIFPPKNFAPSFIPTGLRIGFQLPTQESEETTLAYQFYRLISRASRLCFVYDSRTAEDGSGEISRYLRQLRILLKDKVREVNPKLGMKPFEKRRICIKKDERVQAELNEFLAGGKRHFSASSLKTFISCPLRFYLEVVKRLKKEDFDPEYMNAASYGSVLHKVAEDFYKEHGEGVLSGPRLKAMLSEPTLPQRLQEKALDTMNILYYGGKYTGNLKFMPGEARVLSRLITSYMIQMLTIECEKNENFRFTEGESDAGAKVHQWQACEKYNINFSLVIDRIDSLVDEGNKLRFIDYKTGNDKIKAPSVEALCTDHEYAAIFQLMTYCLAYGDMHLAKYGEDVPIKPVIYKISEMAKDGLPDIKLGGKTLQDYRQFDGEPEGSLRDEFRQEFESLLTRIFDSEIDFTQTDNDANCKYCSFITICGRIAKKDD